MASVSIIISFSCFHICEVRVGLFCKLFILVRPRFHLNTQPRFEIWTESKLLRSISILEHNPFCMDHWIWTEVPSMERSIVLFHKIMDRITAIAYQESRQGRWEIS
jgi:hypothetical protein